MLTFSTKAQEVRRRLIFNKDWKFMMGDHPAADTPAYEDSRWEQVSLPHSFSIPYFQSPDFYTGYGWYRKYFTVTAKELGRKLNIEFEGAFQVAEVFINGKRAGEHRGGYTGFSLDISRLVQAGENVVAVRVNNIWDPALAPRAGEHVFSGGIYRDVYLVITDPVHVAWCGTFVTTPQVSRLAATVHVATEIQNQDSIAHAVKVQTVIIDKAGKTVSQFSSVRTLAAGDIATVDQISPVIPGPMLWHPDHPHLYTALTTLYVGKRRVDEYTTSFGIRSIRWTADQGFFLNGEHLYLQGANVHQDHAGWGDAVTNAGIFRDVQMMKDAGFNFIRGSHYPHDPAFYEACDRLGILFWSENVLWGIGGSDRQPEGYWNGSTYPTDEKDRAPFEASVEQQLEEMIRIHRNHPSVIAWCMSNEPFFTLQQTMAPLRKLLTRLVTLTHQYDPSRPAAIGGAQRPLDSSRIDKIGDIVGYNGDGATLAVFLKPGVPSVVTEYGSTTADRPGNYEPGWGDLAKDSGRNVYPWRSGQAIWCGFDHGSIAGSRLGRMGLVDYFRIPKRAWYWYRNHYRHIPPPEWPVAGTPAALRLTADKLIAGTDGTDDIQLRVTVLDNKGTPISNSPPVTLSIVTGPGEFPTGTAIQFNGSSDIRIQDGQAAIECRSGYAGITIVRATSPGLKPAELRLNFKGGPAYKEEITPRVQNRTYARFTREKKGKELQVFGRNNPTSASSQDARHLSGYAADGNENTWWQAAAGDTSAWWKIDVEKRLAMEEIHISFPSKNIYRYSVELSEDGRHWKTVDDRTENKEAVQESTIRLHGIIAGAVRIRFPIPAYAKLADVTITGEVKE
ncbi:glycoside hydrolase family 2 protein [Chitinophaga tropicalis]|uniref:Beta-galactosidase n=1 Tax=Chitinophaga tropicalis TaxID=2683588 RepID=A0A7K1U7M1_9BACT|nr:glycoside hydrolase family 2 TIM barrel-domain containing protein [Chitinophaga tropicalis]MVT10354.1 beta-galactosidase [Chitinophaga tropicalis]